MKRLTSSLGSVSSTPSSQPASTAGRPRLTGALPLLLHELLEALLVGLHALLFQDFPCQVDGEAEGVVEAEGLVAGQDAVFAGTAP